MREELPLNAMNCMLRNFQMLSGVNSLIRLTWLRRSRIAVKGRIISYCAPVLVSQGDGMGDLLVAKALGG